MADNILILKYLNSLFSMIFKSKSTDLTPKIKNIWTFYHYIHHTLLKYYYLWFMTIYQFPKLILSNYWPPEVP